MFQWLISLISAPLLKSLVDAYRIKVQAEGSAEKIAADLAGRELLVQQAELEAQNKLRIAEIGRWYEPDHILGYVTAVYFAKLLVWDKVLGLGSTDPLAGWAATTANIVVVSYFGKRGFENIIRIWRR